MSGFRQSGKESSSLPGRRIPIPFHSAGDIFVCLFGEPLAEFLRIIPRNAFHGQILPFEAAGWEFPHDRFPLSLCDKEFPHHERFDRDEVLRMFVRVSGIVR